MGLMFTWISPRRLVASGFGNTGQTPIDSPIVDIDTSLDCLPINTCFYGPISDGHPFATPKNISRLSTILYLLGRKRPLNIFRFINMVNNKN